MGETDTITNLPPDADLSLPGAVVAPRQPETHLDRLQGLPSFASMCYACALATETGKTVRYEHGTGTRVAVLPGDNPHVMYEVYYRHLLSVGHQDRFMTRAQANAEKMRRLGADG